MCSHRSFTSGSEDGYVRIHHLDADYVMKDEYAELAALEELEKEVKAAGRDGTESPAVAGAGAGAAAGKSDD